MKKNWIVVLPCLLLALCSEANGQAQVAPSVAHQRHVIASYVEPNTPGAPGVSVDIKVAESITDPAARNTDGTLNLNKAIYVRFFDINRVASPASILVLIPEKNAGAGSMRLIAKEVVKLSQGNYEVWVVDHRSSLLEDIGPMVIAENAKTTQAALEALRAYTAHPAGRGGFLANNPSLLSGFMAEWGLDVYMRDIRSVVLRARQVTSSIYLGGHSQGANLAQIFAGYDFSGQAGFSLLSGLILVQGTADVTSSARAAAISEDDYLNGGDGIVGLNELRAATAPPYAVEADGSCSASLFQILEVSAQLTLLEPQGTILQRFLPQLVRFPATNEAFIGLLLDDEFQKVSIARLSLGFLEVPDGKSLINVATRVGDDPAGLNPNGLWTPVNPGTGGVLRWDGTRDLKTIDDSFVSGPEVSTIADAMRQTLLIGAAEGKQVTANDANSNQWFFPVRLNTDMSLVSDLTDSLITEQIVAAQTARGGNPITLTRTSEVNLPTLAIRASDGVITSKKPFRSFRRMTSIDRADLSIISMPGYSSADVLTSLEPTSGSGKNIPGSIVDFINSHQASPIIKEPLPADIAK
jgi:hypothetical protein